MENRLTSKKPVGVRISAFLIVWFLITASATGVQAQQVADAANAFVVRADPVAPAQAPADVYFGAYRLSNLSVRNAIHDMMIEGDSPLALPGQVERINAVQSALAEWSSRYPRDPWLPSAKLRFANFLAGKQIAQYDRAALSIFDELRLHYPNTWYARYAEDKLNTFNLLPEFDLTTGPDVRQMPLVFETQFATIGANHRHHFL